VENITEHTVASTFNVEQDNAMHLSELAQTYLRQFGAALGWIGLVGTPVSNSPYFRQPPIFGDHVRVCLVFRHLHQNCENVSAVIIDFTPA